MGFDGVAAVAKAADQFRSSDVTVWGLVALATWTVAVLAANISGVIPSSAFAALHASRLEGGTVNQVRLQVADLQSESDRMRRENNLLLQRLALAEEARGDVARRLGALEISLPRLAERIPETAPIDNSATASIGGGRPMSFDAEGGTVIVEQKPLVGLQPGETFDPLAQSAPPPVADGKAFGVAVGFPVAATDAEAQWQQLLAKVGTLLIGLWPVLAEGEGDAIQIVAGPVDTESQATELCARLDKVGIPCTPASFAGEPLPMLN